MVGCFAAIIMSGHLAVVGLVFFLQTMAFRELIAIAHVPSVERQLPWFRTLMWYFLGVSCYFLYGESISQYFKQHLMSDAFLAQLTVHHRFISYILYIAGLIAFTLNLKKNHYKFQFGQFAFTHMILLAAVFQSHFVIHNIMEGLIWFVMPMGLVIFNDIAAYACGKIWGKTPLIQLSPKKTKEGFIGALICTIVFGFFLARFLASFDLMICSYDEYSKSGTCKVDRVFLPTKFDISAIVGFLIPRKYFDNLSLQISIMPLQIHTLIFSVFASLVAPFGGFLASGLKRTFRLKVYDCSFRTFRHRSQDMGVL